EVLPDVDLDAQLGEHVEGGPGGAGQHAVGVDEGQVAGQDGDPLAEAATLAPPAGEGVAGLELDVDGVHGPPGGRPVHDVVVDEGEGVEQLEGGPRVDHHAVGEVAFRSHESPVAERRPQPLAAGQDQLP